MPKYGERSLKVREELHPDLQKIFDTVIKKFDHSLVEGYRGKEAQDKAFEKGTSQVRFPNGKHNIFPSIAVDAYPYPMNDLNASTAREREIYIQRMSYFAGFVMGIASMLYEQGKISHKLVWGADWNSDTELKDHSFRDYPHFELLK